MFKTFFSYFCAFIFFLLTLVVGIFDGNFILQTFFIVLISFLLLPYYYDNLPRKWGVSRRVRLHLIFSVSVIMLLNLANVFRLGVLKEHSYSYRFGYYSGPFRTVYSLPPFQFLIGGIYQLAPLKYRIGIFQAEDIGRVERLKSDVSSENLRSFMCYEKEEGKCFLKVMTSSVRAFPTGTAGTISFFEKIGSALRKDEVLFPENHLQHVKESTELLKLASVLATNPDTELRQLIPDFPGRSQLDDPELIKLLKKEKNARYALTHKRPVIADGPRRGIASKN